MNILTFDIEEWFHILDYEPTNNINLWSSYESRIERNLYSILDLLDKHSVKGTFFVLGWIAEKYPQIIKLIHKQGHEIGSHTHFHQLIYKQKRNDFDEDLKKSIKTIEDITGLKVEHFRAPGFSITNDNLWALDKIIENGIKYDSSIFPAKRAHGGIKNLNFNEPFRFNINGITLKEFPINYYKILRSKFIFSGGGYFRLSPYLLTKLLTKNSNYVMSYFHPRDFDVNQPKIENLTMIRQFKSYVGIKNCYSNLDKWLSEFDFIDIYEANKNIKWDETKELYL